MSRPTTPAAAQTTAYRSKSATSRQLYERAVQVMPGGNHRHTIALDPYPVYVQSGCGCRVTDVEGEERIDFLNNYTALIHGHGNFQITRAAQRQVALGTAFSMPTAFDVELAELLVERVPYIDQVRFCNSGSEAVMLAIHAARAFTGRPKIARFEGAYHGTYDYARVSDASGPENWGDPDAPASVIEPISPPSVAADVVVLPWNNFHAAKELISKHRDDLAALLVDVLPGGIGLIDPQPGFLELLREETERSGALLISDEVMSFRLAYDGAMTASGIRPDLVSLAKIIGGGFPVGAVAGSKRVMSVFDHTGGLRAHHSGTFNANPITMVAGLEAMKQMKRETYERLDGLGDYLRENLKRLFRDRGIAAQVCGHGSLFAGHLTAEPLIDFRSLKGYSRSKPGNSDFCHQMLANGIISSPRGIFGCLSTPMAEAELDAYVEAVGRSLAALH